MTTWKWTRALLAATALSAAALSAAPALARTNYAVLVGVTDYPNLPKKNWLVGPNHDMALVRDYLETRAPVPFDKANVTLLADGLDGASGAPTHDDITAALAAVAAKAVPGDFVYIHLSGHGAQQPERKEGSETDGMDEIFLPSDITPKWVDRETGVPNALVDDEIGAALDAIRNRGAFVWVVFDACHSGSATRAAPVGPDLEVARKLEFDDLGIPEQAVKEAMAGKQQEDEQRKAPFAVAADDASAGDQPSRAVNLTAEDQNATGGQSIAKGGMVAFFAAQTIETTPEMPLPKNTEGAERYGLFSYTILSKLAANPNITYRQLGRAVLQQYSADARDRPTPLFEGDLDAPVFGTKAEGETLEWPIAVKDGTVTVPAGKLHRLAIGTKLAILPSPASPLTDAVGYLEVKSLKNLTSTVVPVAYKDKPALDPAQLPPNAYARLAEVAIDFKLKVARPAATAGVENEVALVDAVLDRINADKDKRFNIELVEPGAEADIRLAVKREALWFLPSSGEMDLDNGRHPPLIGIDPAVAATVAKTLGAQGTSSPTALETGDDATKAAEALLKTRTEDNLEKIFRATSLSRLAAASDYSPDEVSVTFSVKREGKDGMEPLDGTSVPIVNPGDEVHVDAQNLSTKIVDLNVLYVGSDYSITHIVSQRLVPNAKLNEGLLAFTDTSFGIERMIAVLTEAPPQSEVEDLSFLEQGGVPPERRAVGEQGDFSAMLSNIALAPETRGAVRLGDKEGGQKGGVMIFPLETEPKP